MIKIKKVLITFKKGAENGGPFNSHKRIMESNLNQNYNFVPLFIPEGRIGIFNTGLIRYLISEIKKENPDIIHYNGLELIGFYISLSAKLAGVKNRVLAVHGSVLEAENYSFLKKIVINCYEILTIGISTKIYGVSNYVSNWKRLKYLKKYYGTIYNISKNSKKLKTKKNEFRKEIKANSEEIILVSTGRINKEKGYDTLLEVIKKLQSRLEDIKYKFVIVGDGDYLEQMKEESKLYNLENRIIFLGYREDIDEILIESDIFIICTNHETLCMSILEASNNYLPIIAPRVGGISEIVEDEYNGFLIEPKNIEHYIEKTIKLIKNKDQRIKFGKNGHDRINKKFSEYKILKLIDNLYQELLKES